MSLLIAFAVLLLLITVITSRRYISNEVLIGVAMLAFCAVYSRVYRLLRTKEESSDFSSKEKPMERKSIAVPRIPIAPKVVNVGMRTGRL